MTNDETSGRVSGVSRRFSEPAIVIVLPLEAAPIIYATAWTEGESTRLRDWFDHNPDVAGLLDDAIRIRTEKSRRQQGDAA